MHWHKLLLKDDNTLMVTLVAKSCRTQINTLFSLGITRKSKDAVKSKGETDDVKVLKPTTHEDHVPRVDLQSTLTVANE